MQVINIFNDKNCTTEILTPNPKEQKIGEDQWIAKVTCNDEHNSTENTFFVIVNSISSLFKSKKTHYLPR